MIGVARRRQVGKPQPIPAALTGTSVSSFGSGNSGSVSIPAAAKVDDVVLICAIGDPASLPAAPGGWGTAGPPTTVAGVVSFLGIKMVVFWRTVVSGDPGTSVTITGMDGGWPWQLWCRTYTAASFVGNGGTAAINGSPQATPSNATAIDKVVQVTFFGILHQAADQSQDAIAGSGSNAQKTLNPAGFQVGAVEDWLIPTAGGSVSDAGASSGASFPSIAAVSIQLFPVGS